MDSLVAESMIEFPPICSSSLGADARPCVPNLTMAAGMTVVTLSTAGLMEEARLFISPIEPVGPVLSSSSVASGKVGGSSSLSSPVPEASEGGIVTPGSEDS